MTTKRTAVALVGLVLLAGCAEAAQETTVPTLDPAANGTTAIDTALPLAVQLQQAIEAGDADHVALVLQDYTDLDADVLAGIPPLHYAIYRNESEIVPLLIDAGASIEVRDGDNLTPLMIAASFASPDIVQAVLDAGGDMDAIDPAFGDRNAWMYAAQHGNVPALGLLLDHGADIQFVDGFGATAIIAAAFNQHPDAVRFLVEHGADINFRGPTGSTALGWAEYNGDTELAEYLIAAGAVR
jgi:ankyrin repeat protein